MWQRVSYDLSSTAQVHALWSADLSQIDDLIQFTFHLKGFGYCSSCTDYQALMPRSGSARGYDLAPVCAFCIEMLHGTCSFAQTIFNCLHDTMPIPNTQSLPLDELSYDPSRSHSLGATSPLTISQSRIQSTRMTSSTPPWSLA